MYNVLAEREREREGGGMGGEKKAVPLQRMGLFGIHTIF